MTFAAFVFFAELLLILLPGVVLHRALAKRVLAIDDDRTNCPVDEVALLGFGLLPGLAIANTIGTALAVVHAFYWWTYLAAVLLLLAWRWRDALATLNAVAAAVSRSFRSLMRGNLMVIVAVAVFLQLGAAMLIEAQVPSANIDVWNHNFPLAKSIVSNHGFVLPQINNMFYGTYPIFFHMFFAEGLLFFDNVIAAKMANALLYLGFLLSLMTFAKHARAVAAFLIWVLVVDSPFFSGGAADAMADIGRICFSSLAFVFAYQYFRTGRVYFLMASGLLAGGAIAGKYTELLTPILVGASLLPALVKRKPGGWTAVGVFVAATVAVGAYPYLRNLIQLHNPIYPFFFGHPGLTDEYMRGLQAEIFHSLDPVFRTYSQNFLTPKAWRDFASAAHEVFMSHWDLSYYLFAVIAAGMLVMRSRPLLLFALWTFGMWMFWYLVGNMNFRWGLTPFMLLTLTAYLATVGSIDRCYDALLDTGRRWRPLTWSGAGDVSRRYFSGRAALYFAVQLAVAVAAIAIGYDATQRVMANGITSAFPTWLNKDLVRAVRQPGGLNAYLNKAREGYQIYRYVGDHNLRVVLQPFDNGADFYQVAYNDGKKGNWLFPWHTLPRSPAEYDEFIQKNNIRYFVYRPTLAPLNVERLGEGSGNPKHAEMSYDLEKYLMPGSRVILTDPFGWELREISADRLK